MPKYIDSSRAVKEVESVMWSLNLGSSATADVRSAITNIRAADVAPVRHGHWIIEGGPDENGNVPCSCSCCGKGDSHATWAEVPYCWFCGTKMDEGVEK